ncbi:hypothetical protein [Streptomyces diastatochromogenes]|uniref:hypothetical protein n=1 Tax=Streptomyces diastatochromogenes TaxID=42236 RepID=UPI00117E35A0|nr:hypothetical protein [Streptomyces diastatochromogenes]MCZ0985300.1 hypothetical protein [Streptomyces diastatochromogenes]
MVQGLLLPVAVRWAKLPPDTSVDEKHDLAETVAINEAIKVMPQLAVDLRSEPKIVEWLRQEYEAHLASVRARSAGAHGDPAVLQHQNCLALRLALIAHERGTVVRLRDERRIDDTVLRRLRAALDSEEIRLSGGAAVE